MEKTELIAEIIRLYDKVNELQFAIKVCNTAPVESAEKGLDKLKLRFFNDYFDDSEFKDHIVRNWNVPNPKNYTEYEKWLNSIGWDAFLVKFNGFTLNEMKVLFADHLRRYYDDHKKEEEKEWTSNEQESS